MEILLLFSNNLFLLSQEAPRRGDFSHRVKFAVLWSVDLGLLPSVNSHVTGLSHASAVESQCHVHVHICVPFMRWIREVKRNKTTILL